MEEVGGDGGNGGNVGELKTLVNPPDVEVQTVKRMMTGNETESI